MVGGVTVNNIRGLPSLKISWDMPSSDRPILYYEVEYREITNMAWIKESPNPTVTFTTLIGLMLATTYEVRVRAVSDVGNGTWSDTVNETTFNGQSYNLQYVYVNCIFCMKIMLLVLNQTF